MSKYIHRFKDDVTTVFSIGVGVLNVARSLKNISQDLKLLALNGIVQAAKIGNKQGQSLITLSGFLSDLPQQIAPELVDLEELSGELSLQITISSIAVRRFMLYSEGLHESIVKYGNGNVGDIQMKDMNKIANHPALAKADPLVKENLAFLAEKNMVLVDSLSELLVSAYNIIGKSKSKIEKIRRNGFVANYMGSNISIEAAYLEGTNQNFSSLVQNIGEIVEILNQKLDSILEKINESEKLLNTLIKSGISI